MPMFGAQEQTDYRIVVSRAATRPLADLYGFGLREPIPRIALPLKPEDPEVEVDLQTLVQGVYERGSYNLRLDYRQPPPPPRLTEADQEWVEALLAPLRGG